MIRAALSALMMLAGLFLTYGAMMFSPNVAGFFGTSLFSTMATRFAEPFILHYGSGVWFWALVLFRSGPTLLKGLPVKTLLMRFFSIHGAAFCIGLLAMLLSGDISYQMGGVVGVLLVRTLVSIAPAMVWMPMAVVLLFLALNGASSLPFKMIQFFAKMFKGKPQPVLAEVPYIAEESEAQDFYEEDKGVVEYDSFAAEEVPFMNNDSLAPFIEESSPRVSRVLPSDVPSFLRDTHVDLVPKDFIYEPPANHFYEVANYNIEEMAPIEEELVELDDAPKNKGNYQFISDPENFDETDDATVFHIPAAPEGSGYLNTTPVPQGLYHVSPLAKLTIDPNISTDEAAPDPYITRRMDNLTIERDGERLPPIHHAVENSAYIKSFNIDTREEEPVSVAQPMYDENGILMEEQEKVAEPIIVKGEKRLVDVRRLILPEDPTTAVNNESISLPQNTLTPEEMELVNLADKEQHSHLQDQEELRQKLSEKMKELAKAYQGSDTGFTPVTEDELVEKIIDTDKLTPEEITLIAQAEQLQKKHEDEVSKFKQKLAKKMEKLSQTYQVGASYHAFNPNDIVDFLNDEIASFRSPPPVVEEAPKQAPLPTALATPDEEEALLEDFIIPNPGEGLPEHHSAAPKEEEELAPDTLPPINYNNDALFAPFPSQNFPEMAEITDLPPIDSNNEPQKPLIEINDKINIDELLEKSLREPKYASEEEEEEPSDAFSAISFSEIISNPPIFDEKIKKEDDLKHIAPLNSLTTSEEVKSVEKQPETEKSAIKEEPRELPSDYFYQLSEEDIQNITVKEENITKEQVKEEPRELPSDYFYQLSEEDIQNIAVKEENITEEQVKEEPRELPSDYFYRLSDHSSYYPPSLLNDPEEPHTNMNDEISLNPPSDMSFNYTLQEKQENNTDKSEYFSLNSPTSPSFSYIPSDSLDVYDEEMAPKPLPTFEIPPMDPFEVAINHFETESKGQSPAYKLDDTIVEENSSIFSFEDLIDEPLNDEVEIKEETTPKLEEETLNDEIEIKEETTPKLEEETLNDEIEIKEETTPKLEEETFNDEIEIKEETTPKLEEEISHITHILDNNVSYPRAIVDNYSNKGKKDENDELAPEEAALMPRFLREDAPKLSVSTEKSENSVEKDKKKPIFPNSEELVPNTDHIDPLEEEDEIESMIQTIERTFESFNISMKVVDFSRGPSITRFELDPPSGLKLRTVRNLQDDIALQLGISNIRIISPVEGRSYIGIEVPNTLRRSFMLKQFIEDKTFSQSDAALPLILGMDVGGNKISSDLASLPHLLVAGTTGSGKSVYINALISGLLFRRSSEDLKFIMIDPKMVELEPYNGIPHLLAPIITKPEEAMAALEWAVQEMDRRYRLLSEMGVRNIKEYEGLTAKADAEGTWEHLPYIVIIVDEFANLMLRAPKDTEKHISRLAAMARAVGMHLVVATQRPSVDVVTGVIKANFPCRIAFRVSSKIDSRTILDRNGAESLLGKGDMLYISPDYIEAERMQSPFVPGTDVEMVVKAVKRNGPPDYTIDFEEILARQEQSDDGDKSMTDALSDPLFAEVLRYAVDSGEISASGIQRRFRVGYNRASRLIETLKDQRIITPPTSAGKGWQVIISKDEIINFID
ncbi:MAG: DNA translocase FtsK [Brevinema sp.]